MMDIKKLFQCLGIDLACQSLIEMFQSGRGIVQFAQVLDQTMPYTLRCGYHFYSANYLLSMGEH
jgi:hypothetical protein